MIKKTQITIFVLCITLVACKPSEQKLYDFNEKLVGVNNSLQGEMLKLNNLMDDALKSRNFSSISFVLDYTRKDVIRFEADVKRYSTPINGEKFKTTVSDYIKVVREITNVYTELSKLPKTASEEDINKILIRADELQKIEEEKIKAAQTAQEEFAKTNKLHLK